MLNRIVIVGVIMAAMALWWGTFPSPTGHWAPSSFSSLSWVLLSASNEWAQNAIWRAPLLARPLDVERLHRSGRDVDRGRLPVWVRPLKRLDRGAALSVHD